LKDFGYQLWLYEVAESGMYGTINEVKNVNLWEFISCIDYIRAKAKFEELRFKKKYKK